MSAGRVGRRYERREGGGGKQVRVIESGLGGERRRMKSLLSNKKYVRVPPPGKSCTDI